MADTTTPVETTADAVAAAAAAQSAAPSGAETAQATQDIALGLWERAMDAFIGLLRPWNAYQVLIAAGLLIVASLAARFLAPMWQDWLREREGWPTWRMRLGVMIHRRMRLILFVAMIWPVVWIMREVTWPSRSYLLGIVANLTTAWLVIAIATRFIGNAFLRTTVRTAGWAWATVVALGLTEDTIALLDSLALQLGEVRISVWMVVQAVTIVGVLFAVARFISRNTASRIRHNPDISPSMQVLLSKLLQVGLYGAAFFIGLKAVGVDLTGLAVLSGAIGVGLGFGLQKVVSNLVSGFILLLDKSIKPGDVISLGETFGWIEQMGARYVSVVTRDGREYLIPNEDLITGQVVNWSHTDSYVRLEIRFGTAYGSDPHKVCEVAIAAAASVERVLNDRRPVCYIVGFGESSVDYVLRFWIEDPTRGLTNIRGAVYMALWDAFQAHGITIPFPQREVRILDKES